MATSGPLPNPNRRRRNAPTIPTTELPASGRKGDAPEVPAAYDLQTAGLAWWAWAWKLPQAAAWDEGALYVAARRAALEDDLTALDFGETIDIALDDLLAGDDENKLVKHLQIVIRRLKALAGGRVGVMKEMRELDTKLGLSPEALAKLRWTIVDDSEEEEAPKSQGSRASRRRSHLTAVS